MASIYCYDPTVSDEKSKVRGIGRYLQTLKETFRNDWIFTDKMQKISADSVFINPFFNFLQSPLTIKRIAKKQIAVIHDLIPLKYPVHFPVGIKGKLNIFLNKFALKNYDVIVTDSEASKEDIVRMLKVKSKKVKVIYPCLTKIFTLDSRLLGNDTVAMKQLNNVTIPSKFCLYVGDATWNKNLVNLAKAIKEINVTCVFVGKVFEILKQVQDDKSGRTSAVEERSGKTAEVKLDNGWQKELKEFIQMTNGDKRFIFSGFVSDTDLTQLYQNTQCNILVSHDEGFGFSYLEAASLGCPSVLSDIPVLREISASKGALFVNPQNPNEIANAIGELYFNIDKRNTRGLEAKKRIIFFSNSRFKKAFFEILNSEI